MVSERGLYADILPTRHVVDIRAELAGAAYMLETADKCLREGDTDGLAIMLADAAKRARAVLDKPLSVGVA